MLLLDTHIFLWWLCGEGFLTAKEREKLGAFAEKGKLAISSFTALEIELLERKGRVVLDSGFTTWIAKATNPRIVKVIPVDIDVIRTQRKLPDFFHADPADRIITATALHYGMKLATKDRLIVASGAVEIWSV